MQAISPSSPLKSLLLTRRPLARVTPKKLSVHCIYRSDPIHFPNGIGSSRADWQTSCAILASRVVSQEQPTDKSNGDYGIDGSADHVAAVNGHKTSVDLNLVPLNKGSSEDNNKAMKPLTITDLSPAPMHGSHLRVAYQGVPGAYSEAAAGKAYPNCESIPCDQFEVAFQVVELWVADRVVLPVENSLGGSIHRNYDLLLRHRLHIVGEVQLPVHHCLLALPGVRKENITQVISHPQALAQCELSLSKLGLNAAREAVDDTAGAAQHIAANNLRDTAAIASARAAELYGLQILADGIQDDSSNVTRFVKDREEEEEGEEGDWKGEEEEEEEEGGENGYFSLFK
uniref:arogenate dehydratase n=1 Tax=Manihot esculenta TaxID=3983 RepID=A0A2C9V655_MANES